MYIRCNELFRYSLYVNTITCIVCFHIFNRNMDVNMTLLPKTEPVTLVCMKTIGSDTGQKGVVPENGSRTPLEDATTKVQVEDCTDNEMSEKEQGFPAPYSELAEKCNNSINSLTFKPEQESTTTEDIQKLMQDKSFYDNCLKDADTRSRISIKFIKTALKFGVPLFYLCYVVTAIAIHPERVDVVALDLAVLMIWIYVFFKKPRERLEKIKTVSEDRIYKLTAQTPYLRR